MASNRMPKPNGTPPIDRGYPSGPGVLLSAGDFAALMDELDAVRDALRVEPKPVPPNGAELLTALRMAEVEETRVDQVAALVELASMVEDVVAVNGGAGIGSIVKVHDRGGRTTEYELVGRSLPESQRQQAMLGSPTGKALLGARPGDVVRVTLPNGRSRRVRVISVRPTLAGSLRARVQRARASTRGSEIASS
jgi:transcription elongation GreA/GreB family factor